MVRQDPLNGSSENNCVQPIYRGSTYFFKSTEEVIQYQEEKVKLDRYGRYSNPNWASVEKRICGMEHGEDTLIFSSGMNAISTTLIALLEFGDSIIFTENCYRNTRFFLSSVLAKMGIKAIPINSSNTSSDFIKSFESCYQKFKSKAVFLEMPCNPHLYLIDLEKIEEIVDDETVIIVDSTLASPHNFTPLDFGADIVVQSCTKYICGHGDAMAGSISGSQDLVDRVRLYRNVMGGIADPHCASLLSRSLETFSLRMEHYNRAGLEVAQYLESSPHVKRVFYTGLDSHPHSNLARTDLTGHGGVISFELNADFDSTAQFIDCLKLPFMGSNFGVNVAMIEQCSIFTYHQYSEAERQKLQIADSLIRFSIGNEEAHSLIGDIQSALAKVFGVNP